MQNEENNNEKDIEIKLDEQPSEKEIEVPANPIDALVEKAENEEKEKENDKTFENEREVKLEEQKKVPPYSEEMPYSEKVRKRIAKEVAKRAEAEQKAVDLEQRLAQLEKKTFEIASKSLKNNYTTVSSELKSAIEEGNTDKQVELYEKMADIRGQMSKADELSAEVPKTEKKEKSTPPLAADWVKENREWFNKPGFRKETAMAYGIDAELTEEGWDVNDPDYYIEMDKRLKTSGLKYFDKSSEEAVQTDKNVVQKNNRVQSPVAGVSRKKGNDSNRVKLTSDDINTAKTFGIDINDEAALKRFAKEVKTFSNNT
jgi:hypothetical protein|tara:strand:+ start:162 stop:1106 length:945 start_codon:yes stop_codon:yes gene_type:complete